METGTRQGTRRVAGVESCRYERQRKEAAATKDDDEARICVWNSSDGSLVHSLIGIRNHLCMKFSYQLGAYVLILSLATHHGHAIDHITSENTMKTFVLDVHPFNPRIAMSAGYDGKTIIWDIWEGKPVQIYETDHYKLVDGKFSPDGTSLVLTDEIGQIFIIGTGQGESQKDAKYDQFFLGDYWPLVHDTNGSAIDQETQLAPYRRNIQDLLCDSGMIPYPEPFQSMYQKHRLGTLGIEWRPPSVHFAVGPTYDATTGEYQTIPVIDPDRWEPLPEITDFIELEPENEVISDDTDSEYNGMDDYSSEGEQEFWGGHSSGASYSSPEIDVSNHNSTANLRRSRRKKKRSDADLITSSDRRVTKRNLDGHSVATPSRPHRGRKSKTVRSTKRKRSPKYRGLRPQRRATHSTHSFFSNIKTSTEEEDGSASSLSDSGLNTESTEAEQSAWHGLPRLGRETNQYDSEDVTRPSQFTETKGKNSANSRKLILRMPRRDLKTQLPSESANPELPPHYRVLSLPAARYKDAEPELAFEPGSSSACKSEPALASGLHDVCTVHSNDAIKVGELKLRSSKQFKFGDSSSGDMWVSSNNALSQDVDGSGSHKTPHQYDNGIQQTVEQNIQKRQRAIYLDSIHENHNTDDYSEGHLPGKEWIADNKNTHLEEENNMEHKQQFHSTRSISFKLKLYRPRGFADGASSSDKSKASAVGSDINYVKVSMQHDEASATSQHRSSGFPSVSRSFQDFESAKTYGAVCKMSEPSKHKTKLGSDAFGNEHSTSVSNDDGGHQPPDCSPIAPTGSLRRNKRRSRAYTDYGRGRGAISHVQSSSLEAATSGRRIVANVREVMWGSTSKTADIKSAMNKRESCHFPDTHLLEKKHQVSRYPWLMLLEHEDIYRYIPQLGDEVMYLRQGHEEYVNEVKSLENCPSNWIKSLKAAELCKIKGLDYKPDRGSGESCCELTIKFIDHTSSGFGKEFVITLRELVTFPDFLVERTWFEATTTYNWSVADRCKVWWMGVGEDGGSWWEGRVLDIRPRSPDFPESPWEKYIIQYENDGSEHPHSPWEVHDANNPLVSWKRPHIAPSTRNKLLSAVTGLQEKSLRNQDRYGVMKLDTAAGKSDFINRFPVQFSIEVIRARLQSDYYRTLEAVKHDVSVMLANAKSYFSNSCEMTKKIRKLSEWIQDKILSL
ncbi:Retrovirus-related Pol polyprotein from transposon TNT 1-94 [Hordeum vulgare]|nr:Retrovirus-related Pol polyprotein from transposon TNT 1-94 [Hordeum vulgare]